MIKIYKYNDKKEWILDKEINVKTLNEILKEVKNMKNFKVICESEVTDESLKIDSPVKYKKIEKIGDTVNVDMEI